ncbi:hypothetical protein Tco_0267923 [Tanacetum coccineum]
MAQMGFCDKHNMVAFLQKPSGSEEFHQIVDFLADSHIRYALTANPTIYVSLVEQFWQTATVEIVNDGEQQITVTVDGHKFAITEASKRFLNAHNAVYVAPSLKQKLFSNMKIGFSGVHVPLFDTMLLHGQSGQVARVTSLEIELKKTKEVHGKALTKLVKRVKKLEDMLKSTNKRKKAKMVISDEEEELVSEDPSKQGRMEETEYADVEEENAGVEYDFDLTEQQVTPLKNTYNRRRRSTHSSQVSTAAGLFSTAKDIQDTNEEQTKALEQQEQERANLEAALKLQKQFDQERKAADDIDWSKIIKQAQERQLGSMIRYHSFKKKPVTVAQARKNMMVYLRNMANYKMKYFKGMSYDQIRPIFEEEYRKEDLKKMLEIVPVKEFRVEALQTKVGNITEAYQGFEDMLKAFDRGDLDTLWSLVKENFRSVEPTEDMEKARLYGSCAVHYVFSTRGHYIYMFPEKDYPLTTEVMMLMLSRGLQVEEDSEMAKDLVKKIFIEANRSRS